MRRLARGTRRLAVLWAAACALAPSGRAETYDPYRIPRAQFEATVHTLALRPLLVPSDIDEGERVGAAFEACILETMRRGGYSVVESSEYARLWRGLSEQLGGVYDPATGQADPDRLEAVRDHTFGELASRFGVDALLVPRVVYADAEPWLEPYRWQIATEALPWGDDFLRGYMSHLPQKVRAVHLAVQIWDLLGAELYNVRTLIRWTELYVARGHRERPKEEYFASDDLNWRAVRLALARLVPKPQARPVPPSAPDAIGYRCPAFSKPSAERAPPRARGASAPGT